MGVPAFYRWLRDKFGKCIEDVVEEEPMEVGGLEVPVAVAGANPNGIEFDNLYVDMNGIIHPCVHPEDVPAPETEEEMFAAIFAYLDRLVCAVRPRRLLYLAIDGVAPRAKMNQQRSRRFKTAADMAEEEEVEEELRAKMRARGQRVPPRKKATFDHNVITPGTRFMDRLSHFLRYLIVQRQNTDAGWRTLRVVLSDASVPGEGEHKIMEFIRQQRAQPGYNPNTVHCLHGLDADLIMLGLATHEARFTILREDILGKKTTAKCFVCGKEGHRSESCASFTAEAAMRMVAGDDGAGGGSGAAGAAASRGRGAGVNDPNSLRSLIQRKPLQFLHIAILREYLDLEFRSLHGSLPFAYDLERLIDDFVFMCFFVGNDFLPHLPSMDIREGAIDLLLAVYKQVLPAMGGYIADTGTLDLARVDILLARVAAVEEEIFVRRKRKEDRDARFESERRGGGGGSVGAALEDGVATIARVHKAAGGSGDGDVATVPAVSWTAAAAAAPPPLLPAPPATAVTIATTDDGAKRRRVEAASPVADGAAVAAGNATAAALLRAQLLARVSSRETPAGADAGVPSLDSTPAAPPSAVAAAADGGIAIDDAGIAVLGGDAGAPTRPDGDDGGIVAAVATSVAGLPQLVAGVKRPREEADAATARAAAAADAGDATAVGDGEMIVPDFSPLAPESSPMDSGAPEELTVEAALEEGMLEEGVAAAVSSVMRGAVLRELMAKRTHDDVRDAVQLGVPGWRERYYAQKFGAENAVNPRFMAGVYRSYTEGLRWVFEYYYQGVASWTWFYPYHYAPFASDLRNLDRYEPIVFTRGAPFRPLEQLMGVLPPRSSHALPSACAELMQSASSPVRDFYPLKFDMDPNGKKFTWQWVVLLPFIDERRLVAAIESVAATFTAEEQRRNLTGNDFLFVHTGAALYRFLEPLMARGDAAGAAAGAAAGGGGGSTETGAAAAAGQVPMVQLRPHMGDAASKGFSLRCVAVSDSPARLRGVAAPRIGGTMETPWEAKMAPLAGVATAMVVALSPDRKKHLCIVMPGVEPYRPVLDAAEDDPTGRIPRLTKGLNIADLAIATAPAVSGGGGLAAIGAASSWAAMGRGAGPSWHGPPMMAPGAGPMGAYGGSGGRPAMHHFGGGGMARPGMFAGMAAPPPPLPPGPPPGYAMPYGAAAPRPFSFAAPMPVPGAAMAPPHGMGGWALHGGGAGVGAAAGMWGGMPHHMPRGPVAPGGVAWLPPGLGGRPPGAGYGGGGR